MRNTSARRPRTATLRATRDRFTPAPVPEPPATARRAARTEPPSETTSKESSGVQSLETGLGLLSAFMDLEPLPMLKTLAARAGMPPAKAHRYLASYCKTGYVERDSDTGRYRLGPNALRLGLAAMNGLDAVRVARPLLAGICQRLDHPVFLAVWGATGATVVLLENAGGPITLTARVGMSLPMLSSSTGLTFGAWLPRAATRALIEAELARTTRLDAPGVPRSLAEAEALFREIRRRGLARATGQLNPGVNAFSAPVFDHAAQVAAVLSTLGPARSFSADWNGETAYRLREAAGKLTTALGGVTPQD